VEIIVPPAERERMRVEILDTRALGDRSYLVHDGSVAVVIDPQRDVDRVHRIADAAGVRITHVAETHIHNDYVTGGHELARRLDAEYLVNAADDVSFQRRPVRDGDRITVGGLTVTVVGTPGHTEHHLAYVVSDEHGPSAVFSGGNLLYGTVGRTDLVDDERTVELTHAQYRSARRLAGIAADDAVVYPTHGFGSFCASGAASGTTRSTVGEQRTENHALTDADEDHFVEQLIAGLVPYPSYYVRMSPMNRTGPGAPDLSTPQPLDPAELRARLHTGEWVVDLRNRVAFADSHLQGTLSFEYGDGSSFTTFLGWIMPWDERLTLVGAAEDIENAIRDLSRIGIDSPDAVPGDPAAGSLAGEHPLTSYPSVTWHDLADAQRDGEEPLVLDVRRADEFRAGHIDGAQHVPLQELLRRIGEVPDRPVWVHCAAGYRASIAASILHRAGHDVRHLSGKFDDAGDAGLALTG
jgi:hydroxyacylglutathione hydrolase